jgi:NAD(P)-dependent dehydrogenase (short-subunit alcohol dehydrogenase family)
LPTRFAKLWSEVGTADQQVQASGPSSLRARPFLLRQQLSKNNMTNSLRPSATILITGASTGIGAACARTLDRRGFRVFAGVRSEAAGEKLKLQASSRLTPLKIDVTNTALIAAAAKTVGEAVGDAGLAGLVNNAGVAVPGPLELVPLEAWRRQFEVNVLGQVAVTQAFLPLLRQASGRIVNISSVSGGLALPYMGPYSASKHAIEAITDALRFELRPWNIRVSAIEPGPIETPIWAKSTAAAEELSSQTSEELRSLYRDRLALIEAAIAYKARTAAPVASVVRAVVHALTAKNPKTRYLLNWNAWLSFKGLRMLPDWFRDWIIRRAIGLP